jgi:hypothetical protein
MITFGTNEVLPKSSSQTYGLEPRHTLRSVLGNAILTSRPIASVFTF